MKLKSVRTKKKRIGRGTSAGGGDTSGRGNKGQRSRSGFNIPKRFEGGQTPLSMRLPKLPGFKSKGKKAVLISLDQLSNNFSDGDKVTIEILVKKNLIAKSDKIVKILNNGKLTKKLSLDPKIKTSKSVAGLFIVAETKPAEIKADIKPAKPKLPKAKPISKKKPTLKKD